MNKDINRREVIKLALGGLAGIAMSLFGCAPTRIVEGHFTNFSAKTFKDPQIYESKKMLLFGKYYKFQEIGLNPQLKYRFLPFVISPNTRTSFEPDLPNFQGEAKTRFVEEYIPEVTYIKELGIRGTKILDTMNKQGIRVITDRRINPANRINYNQFVMQDIQSDSLSGERFWVFQPTGAERNLAGMENLYLSRYNDTILEEDDNTRQIYLVSKKGLELFVFRPRLLDAEEKTKITSTDYSTICPYTNNSKSKCQEKIITAQNGDGINKLFLEYGLSQGYGPNEYKIWEQDFISKNKSNVKIMPIGNCNTKDWGLLKGFKYQLPCKD